MSDSKIYNHTADHWYRENTLGQFLDIKVTASRGGTSEYVKLALFLQHAEALLGDASQVELNKDRRTTLQHIKQALDGMGKGISSWAQHDEDYLTLLVMSALSSVPHRMGLFPVLRDWKLIKGEPSAPAWSNGWPQVRPEALKTLGYTRDIRYVTPDWLVETPEHLVFFEFKRPDEDVPNQGAPEKLGRMLALGDHLAELGKRKFSMAVMTSEEGQRVKITPGGTVSLADALERSLDAVVASGVRLHRSKEDVASTVVPLTWTQVLATMHALPERLREMSKGDPWLVGQYSPAVRSATEELERALKGAGIR